MITVSLVVQLIAALFLIFFASMLNTNKATFAQKIIWKFAPFIIGIAVTLSAFKVF